VKDSTLLIVLGVAWGMSGLLDIRLDWISREAAYCMGIILGALGLVVRALERLAP
jgi:hypothetical protein